ncbi:hypothetical protein ALI22I_16485 [Saccharothrix sp. ALI-22-I]|uniref:hypothetical protein n=1 Tax=Saccharothrix sp. ALI-22-I TaxID=1933778 RepID=UPI00097C8379|nr:hypothetical protein [Saccharothrix sp. ALI-22-I]ONI89110.1 hypothetical protein ALI22I_16485 [Saccharothrix sp. ALI-22-I]
MSTLINLLAVPMLGLCLVFALLYQDRPRLLVKPGREFVLTVGVIIALTVLTGGQAIPDPTASGGLTRFVALLELAVLVVGCTAIVVGYRRRSRWLRSGPPADPAPPGVTQWPPEEGEVWLAIVTHDDERKPTRNGASWSWTPRRRTSRS